jgi:hypothetical protein
LVGPAPPARASHDRAGCVQRRTGNGPGLAGPGRPCLAWGADPEQGGADLARTETGEQGLRDGAKDPIEHELPQCDHAPPKGTCISLKA